MNYTFVPGHLRNDLFQSLHDVKRYKTVQFDSSFDDLDVRYCSLKVTGLPEG